MKSLTFVLVLLIFASFASASVGYNMYGGDVVNSYKVSRLEDGGLRFVRFNFVDKYNYEVHDDYDNWHHSVYVVEKEVVVEKESDNVIRLRSDAENYWRAKYYDEKKAKSRAAFKNIQDEIDDDVDDRYGIVGGSSYYNYYSPVFRKYIKVKCYDSAPEGKLLYKKCP